MPARNKMNSPYSASLTGGGFMFAETLALLPLLMSPESDSLLKDEILNNRVLHITSEKSRQRNVSEIKRRYNAVPESFWNDFREMSEDEQKLALFYVILKSYKIAFDFQFNVTLKKWNSVTRSVELDDVMFEFNRISSNDEFVDSWSDTTKRKVASAFLSILRHIGMLDKESNLQSVKANNLSYYITIGEPWFLEACLLQPYEIESLKRSL